MGDPFDELRLDEDFVRSAEVSEASAAERVRRAGREPERRVRRTPRRPRRTLPVLAAVAGIAWLSVSARDGDRPIVLGARPPAGVDAADEPLGTPPPAPATGGPHGFLHVQDDGTPVAYDPCREIHVVLNHRTAPAGGTALIEQALADVTAATGLRFVVDGPSSEAPLPGREPYQQDRYGDRWAPVLVAWTDPLEVPDLDGDVAGQAGSVAVSGSRDDDLVYVTGTVALDGPQIADIIAWGGPEEALGVVRHELGHLVGLDHVTDPTQLMHDQGMPGITTFQDGDRTGLAALGAGRCRPDV